MRKYNGDNYFVISDVEIMGIDSAVRRSKYPFALDVNDVNSEITKTVNKLASAPKGSGHDTFLKGIRINFDLTFTKQAWGEAERYKFLDFISSQSSMHCILRFDLEAQCIEWVDEIIMERMKFLVNEYNEDPCEYNFRKVIYNTVDGLILTAGMTTNYQQLKTIYSQRRTHRLPEWQEFCDRLEMLPHSEWITGKEPEGMAKLFHYLNDEGFVFECIWGEGKPSQIFISDYPGDLVLIEAEDQKAWVHYPDPEMEDQKMTADQVISLLACFKED